VRLRLLPTVASIQLLALVAELAPSAELLGPCPSDAQFRELAGSADVVLCADAADEFDRRSLVAAGAGAAVVTSPEGPAHAVLGDQAVTITGLDHEQLRAALKRALRAGPSRDQRAAAVRASCATEACGQRIAALASSTVRTDAA
jgi:hypothetical protein